MSPVICPVGPGDTLLCTFDGRLSTPTEEIVSYTWLIGLAELSGAVLANPVANLGTGGGYRALDVTLRVRSPQGNQASIVRPVTFVTDSGAQDGCPPCYSVSPTSTTVPAAGGSFEFQVIPDPPGSTDTTSWYPGVLAPTSSWITVNSPTSGSGSGTVRYTVAPNSTGAPRSGVIRIFYPDQSVQFTVSQSQ